MFDICFGIMFVLVIVLFVVALVKILSQWNKNNHSPRLTVDAEVVSRRTSVSTTNHPVGGDASGASGFYTTSSTTYYATFEVESGDRMEFSLRSDEYAMLREGDRGKLNFQGTRFLSFVRM